MQIDWAVVVATFFGPIFAVGITLWHQHRSRTLQVQMQMFCDMMKWRRDITHFEFVAALNLVPVHFRKNRIVLAAYSRLMDTLSDPSWNVPEAQNRVQQKSWADAASLLHEISKAVRCEVNYATISDSGYAPTGWLDEMSAQRQLRERLAAVLAGEVPLSVVLTDADSPQKDPAA